MKIGIQTWGSEGDVRPFIALADGLVRSGHNVTLAISTDKPRNYHELAKKYGFDINLLITPDTYTHDELAKIWQSIILAVNPIKQAELVLKYGFDPIMEDMYNASKELCKINELVIGHFFVFPLQIAAEKAGIPMVTINIVHNCLPSTYIWPPGIPNLGKWSYSLGWKLVRFMINRIFLPRVNSLRKREGLSIHKDVMSQTWASKKLNLIAVSPIICQRPPDWASNNQVCGFLNPESTSIVDELPKGLEEFIDSGSAPIYATFGSMMTPLTNQQIKETVDIWIGAIKKLNLRGILQVPFDNYSEFGNTSDIFIVKRSPYVNVFPKCLAIIHHGGAGTTQSALLSGKPSVIVAHMSDQFFWGAELERLGVASQTLKRASLSINNLAESISQLLSSNKYQENAKELGDKLKAENGVRNAIKIINEAFNI
ncbi:MAG: glycosyltransferase [Ferruginibacter sp.]